MNKKDLKDFVSEELGSTKAEAGLVINTVLDGIVTGLETDGKVTLVGFGTFTAVKRSARKARNPKTGEPIDVPEKVVPKFKASAKMKDIVAGVDLDDMNDTDTDTE
jgi:DNA-binding protein HU-beta